MSVPCPLCGHAFEEILGIRGNREHTGADPKATPHLWTHVVRCRRCGFIFTSPVIPEAAELERSYYNDPQRYAASTAGDIASMYGRRVDLIQREVRSGRLLDVGAGKGEFLAVAARRGFDATGVEPSSEFCAYAARISGVRVLQGVLDDDLSSELGRFDVVTLNHVLEHVDQPVALLQRIRNNLSHAGVLFVEVPNCESHLVRTIDAYFRARNFLQSRRLRCRYAWSSRLSPVHPPFHKYGYSERSLRYALMLGGYRTLAVKTFSGRDRGVAVQPSRLDVTLRKAAFDVFDRLGNRELLCAVATPAS